MDSFLDVTWFDGHWPRPRDQGWSSRTLGVGTPGQLDVD